MKMTVAFLRQGRSQLLALAAVCVLAAGSLQAQSPAVRIQAEVNNYEFAKIPGSQHPLAQPRFDAGRMPAATKLEGITLIFSRSAAQEAALKALIQAQQTPGSPGYHKWLKPDEFAARFGMAQEDIDKVEAWLQQEGFTIDSVSRSNNAIHFTGTVAQVEQAFDTEMHYYNVDGKKHFAPSTALSVPAAIAPVVTTIRNLDDFRPKPMHIRSKKAVNAKPAYTFIGENNTQYALFAPGDIKVAYDINPLISAGDTGTGQTIAIMGQSAIQTTDITNFQDAAGLPANPLNQILVPNSGSSTVYADGDEGESDLDLEWSGAIATGATIDFVYTGSNPNYDVFNSYEYAVEEDLAPIISISYGDCETDLGQSNYTAFEAYGEQAVSQGQTVFAASGDSGATGCYGYTDLTTSQQDAVAVNYPASSEYVTGVGGTEITSANATPSSSNPYWQEVPSDSTTGIILTSANEYIPEIAWNDDSLSAVSGCEDAAEDEYDCLSASGGGISTLSPSQPTWQSTYFSTTGESNPSSSHRLVPDVALYASPNYPGYLFCTSDESDWAEGQEASCGDGEFYDDITDYFTVAGGTSFASPIFAGMTAILNQAKNYTTGQGLLNTQLYSLAANSTTYAAAFHDVTSGNNECTEGSSVCPSSSGYSAGTGYDMVTGLGSVDLNALVTAWPESSSTAIGTTTTISATNTSPTVNVSDDFTITVAAASGTTAPAGTVNVSINGGTATSYTLTASTTTAASTATFSNTFTTAGTYTITATFEPTDSTAFSSSTGTTSVTVQGTSTGTGTIAASVTPSTLTVAQGNSGTETVTITPSNGYTGTVLLGLDFGSSDTTLGNLCYEWSTQSSSGDGEIVISQLNTAETGTLTLDTNASDCASSDAVKRTGMQPLRLLLNKHTTARNHKPNIIPEGIAFAGLLMIGFFGRRSRKLRGLVAVLLLATVGMAISACGSSTTGTGTSDPPKGTYTGTISAQDSVTSSITSSTTFSFVID